MADVTHRCPEHSGHDARIETLERNVSTLFDKNDKMSGIVNRLYVSSTLLLIGVVVDLMIRLYAAIPKH